MSCSGRRACRARSTATRASRSRDYGRSNVGRMKHVYRLGLGHRYGRVMQAISGVHFNYSFPEHFWPVLRRACRASRRRSASFVSAQYFGLLRNYRRHGWIVLYLFGDLAGGLRVLPAAAARSHGLEELAPRNLVRAARDVAAHERPRLPQQEPGGRCRSRSTASTTTSATSRTRSARRTPTTSASASRSTANTASSTPTSCRSRTSTTASSGRSA